MQKIFNLNMLGKVFMAVVMLWWFTWYFSLTASILLLLCIFLHECGHIIGFNHFKVKHGGMIFIPMIGAGVQFEGAIPNTWASFVIFALGPVMGFVASLLMYFVYLVTGFEVALFAGYASVALNLFNLIPLPPMDGSHMLMALLRSRNWIDQVMGKLALLVFLVVCYSLSIYLMLAVLAVFLYVRFAKGIDMFYFQQGILYILKVGNIDISVGALRLNEDEEINLDPMNPQQQRWAKYVYVGLIVAYTSLAVFVIRTPEFIDILDNLIK